MGSCQDMRRFEFAYAGNSCLDNSRSRGDKKAGYQAPTIPRVNADNGPF